MNTCSGPSGLGQARTVWLCRITRPVDGWRGMVGMRHVGVLVFCVGAAPRIRLGGMGSPPVPCLGVVHQVGGKAGASFGSGAPCRLDTCGLADFLGVHPATSLTSGTWRRTTPQAFDFRVRAVQRWATSGPGRYEFLDRDCDRAANLVLRVRGLRYHGQAWRPFVLLFACALVLLASTFPGLRAFLS